jgi:hypothetical protein
MILMTRGINRSFEEWKKFMETQLFNFKQVPILRDAQGNHLKNPDGTTQYGPEMITRVQGALRPIQLFEYVFPQESLGEVLAMQNIQNCFPLRPEVSSWAWIIRKMMGAKKIPQEFLDTIKNKQSWEITSKYVPMMGQAVYPLGIKEDVVQDFDFGKEGAFKQEGL